MEKEYARNVLLPDVMSGIQPQDRVYLVTLRKWNARNSCNLDGVPISSPSRGLSYGVYLLALLTLFNCNCLFEVLPTTLNRFGLLYFGPGFLLITAL